MGRLAPLALAAWLLLDLGLRMLPAERFRVTGALAAERFAARHAPYRPNFSAIDGGSRIGGNAATGNLPPTEWRSPARFSTDGLGYRLNPEAAKGGAPDVLVLWGDSFTYGAHLSDDETLPAALTRRSGLDAYNAGRSYYDPLTLTDLDWLLAQLPGRPRTAVLVHLEQHNRARPGSVEPGLVTATANVRDEPDGPAERVQEVRRDLGNDLRYARRLLSNWWRVSPLQNATRRLFRALNNDRVLPNEHKRGVIQLAFPTDGRCCFGAPRPFPCGGRAARRACAARRIFWSGGGTRSPRAA